MQTKPLTTANDLVRSIGPLLVLAALIVAPACSAVDDGSPANRAGSSGRASGGRGNAGGAGAVSGAAGGSGFAGTNGSGSGGTNGSGSGGTTGSSAGGTSGSGFGGASGSGFGGASGAGAGGANGASGSTGAGGSTGVGGGAGASGGTAGTAGSGGSGGTGGATGSGGTGGGGPNGGYMTFGSWHGYAWTATGGTGSISPPNFGTVSMPPLCASGELAPGNDNVALLGVNLNQAETPPNAPLMTVVPTLDGINVSVTNNGNSPLRVQIQGPNGQNDENQRWCAPLFGSGGFIPWNAFNTKCWDGTGAAYQRQPIVAAMILVPGGAGTVRFDFCLNNMGAANDPSGPGGGGCSLSGGSGEGSGSFSGDFDWRGVTRGGRNYIVHNNVWGQQSATQTLSYSGVSFTVTQQTGDMSGSGDPVSYPSVFIGSNNNRSTTGSNLPRQVGALTSVQTGWSWSGFPSGIFNAAYDVWFSSGSGGDPGNPSGGYLMVWFYKPGNKQPIGAPPQGVVSLAGGSWNIYIGTQLGRPIVSYVRTETINSLSFDLNDFIRDAVNRGVLGNSMYLTNIFAGFEIWSGGVGLRTDNFCAVVN